MLLIYVDLVPWKYNIQIIFFFFFVRFLFLFWRCTVRKHTRRSQWNVESQYIIQEYHPWDSGHGVYAYRMPTRKSLKWNPLIRTLYWIEIYIFRQRHIYLADWKICEGFKDVLYYKTTTINRTLYKYFL